MAINYELAEKQSRGLKAQLTRAINSKDRVKVEKACRDAIKAWEEWGAWPDQWSRWERALNDVRDWNEQVDLQDWYYGQ
jgi:hypothetical protein